MTNIFTFKTPDNKFIQLKKLTFSEKTDILLNVTDKQRIRTLDTAYTDKENYKACVYKDGSVCFVKNISQKAKRAFWFESKAAFEYYFYYVFDNEVS